MKTTDSTAITVYGIPNCDTVKKARTWLSDRGISYHFHDFKKSGVPAEQLDQWLGALDWQKLVNRQGLTWRKLPAAEQAAVVDSASARALMLAHSSVIKRPVTDWGPTAPTRYTIGFQPDAWPLDQ